MMLSLRDLPGAGRLNWEWKEEECLPEPMEERTVWQHAPLQSGRQMGVAGGQSLIQQSWRGSCQGQRPGLSPKSEGKPLSILGTKFTWTFLLKGSLWQCREVEWTGRCFDRLPHAHTHKRQRKTFHFPVRGLSLILPLCPGLWMFPDTHHRLSDPHPSLADIYPLLHMLSNTRTSFDA